MSFNDRTIMAMGEEKYNKIANHHVLLIGVGGVGGAVFECLVRFGIKNISIIDYDTVDETNLNRQLISSVDSIGKLKVDVAKARRRRINPNITVNACNKYISNMYNAWNFVLNHINDDFNLDFIKELGADYIIDAFDTVKAKLSLIEFCHKNNIKIISAMGTGGRFSVDGFTIDTIDKTAGNGCGLSRVMRTELRKRGITDHMCLFNKYPPESKATKDGNGRHAPGSTPFAPNIAGIMLAQYVCEQFAEE